MILSDRSSMVFTDEVKQETAVSSFAIGEIRFEHQRRFDDIVEEKSKGFSNAEHLLSTVVDLKPIVCSFDAQPSENTETFDVEIESEDSQSRTNTTSIIPQRRRPRDSPMAHIW